jgi:hypothetical protein
LACCPPHPTPGSFFITFTLGFSDCQALLRLVRQQTNLCLPSFLLLQVRLGEGGTCCIVSTAHPTLSPQSCASPLPWWLQYMPQWTTAHFQLSHLTDFFLHQEDSSQHIQVPMAPLLSECGSLLPSFLYLRRVNLLSVKINPLLRARIPSPLPSSSLLASVLPTFGARLRSVRLRSNSVL